MVAPMSLFLTILPIAIAIAMGWAARATGLVRDQDWPGIEALSFRVLIPVILIHAIAGADLSLSRVSGFGAALLLTVAALGLAALALGRLLPGLSSATASTLFQTATRFHGFIALAAADLLLGLEGLELLAVAMALLVPVINVANIAALAVLLSGAATPGRVVRAVASNPLVIGCALGLAANAAGGLPPGFGDAIDIVGRAALGVGLLAVGAGIRPARLLHLSAPVVAGAALRPVLAPALFLALAALFGLPPAQTLAGLLVFAVPAAANGYIVAKAMGGDADLYADLMAWQTLLSMAAIPAYAALI